MNWTTLIGTIAAVCTTVAFLPQAIKVVKTKHTKAIIKYITGIMKAMTNMGNPAMSSMILISSCP